MKGEKIHLEKCERGFEPFSLDFTTELEIILHANSCLYIVVQSEDMVCRMASTAVTVPT